MSKPRNDLVDRLIYIAYRILALLVYWFKPQTGLRIARIFATVWNLIDREHRSRAEANLRQSFPELTKSQCAALARQSLQNLFMLAVEAAHTTRRIRIDTFENYVTLENFKPTLELLMSRKAVIMLTGHYGNWEILGYVLATLGFDSTTVARPLDNPYLNEWVFGVRARQGQKIVGKKGATAEITRLLANGGLVAFVADQNAGHKGIFVDFFGRKASTYKSIGLLAMEYEVPVVVGYARRMNGGFQFAMGTQDIIWPRDWKDQPDPLRYITQRYTTAIEQMVRQDPAQYLWAHRRWKTRPKGEEPLLHD
jgi:Kdo2-lipid IVA lauroyltransferase/acyltransferase